MVEIGGEGRWRGGGEAALGGVEEEGGVEAGGGAEGQCFPQKGEGNGDLGAPAGLVTGGGGEDAGDGFLAIGAADAGCGEEAGPPTAIGGEIDFEVVVAGGMTEEELGDVGLPQLGLEDSGSGGRMNSGGAGAGGAKVEMGGVEGEEVTRWRGDGVAVPVS